MALVVAVEPTKALLNASSSTVVDSSSIMDTGLDRSLYNHYGLEETTDRDHDDGEDIFTRDDVKSTTATTSPRVVTTTTTPLPINLVVHGGLENLGNTCYMASAIQMLASAEGFVESLDDGAPLRRAFTTLLRNLRRNAVVRPERLKAAIDQRSTLFHGYRQQDSNELLVTLLDLLDEEYKKTTPNNEDDKEEEVDVSTNENDAILLKVEEETIYDNDDDSRMESKSLASSFFSSGNRFQPEEMSSQVECEEAIEYAAAAVAEEETEERSTATTVVADDDEYTVSTSATHHDDEDSTIIAEEDLHPSSPPQVSPVNESESSPSSSQTELLTKKARLFEPTPATIESLNPWRSSFSTFTLEDIGRLLHGDPSDALILPDVSTTCIGNEPQYKLVGGRMNTTDVVLKPYAEYNNDKKGIPLGVESSSTLSSSNNELPSMVNETTTPIDAYFKTLVRIKLTCDSCLYTRHHTETFWQLSLEIGSDHVEDALRRFFAPCKQELKCEKCFCDTATQTMEIEELPPYLLLHFKRFIVDISPDYSSISYRKDGSPVYFDDRLCLNTEDYFAESSLSDGSITTTNIIEYRLISVVNHIGQSASCGHYTADAQRIPGEWKRFNDSYVSTITEQQAIDQSRHTAYMVLYQLENNGDNHRHC